jgi:hypothetical protein
MKCALQLALCAHFIVHTCDAVPLRAERQVCNSSTINHANFILVLEQFFFFSFNQVPTILSNSHFFYQLLCVLMLCKTLLRCSSCRNWHVWISIHATVITTNCRCSPYRKIIEKYTTWVLKMNIHFTSIWNFE